MKYDLTVVIPTYNEEGNISEMIRTVDGVCKSANITNEILVVDDNSTDGTIQIVKELQNEFTNLNLLVRYEDHGLSQSLYDAFKHVQSEYAQVIDCDFTHPPERIPDLYEQLRSGRCDMVIGSRYVKNGGIENWPYYRVILSSGSTIFAKALIPFVKDSGSGFFGIKVSILENCTLRPRGFRMGFEIIGKANWTNIIEIPVVLRERKAGYSKLKFSIITDYLIQCCSIAWYNLILRKSNNVKRSWKIYLHKRE